MSCKFRAVHNKGQEITIGGKLTTIQVPGFLYDSYPGEVFKWREQGQDIKSIDQFIGLKDKYGKEIYNGDIVTAIVKGDNVTGQIIFQNARACFSVMYKTVLVNTPNPEVQTVVVPICDEGVYIENVIGNIYSIEM